MVLPVELIEALRRRASERGQSITAYVAALIRSDLGQPCPPDPLLLAEQLQLLQARVEALERQLRSGSRSASAEM